MKVSWDDYSQYLIGTSNSCLKPPTSFNSSRFSTTHIPNFCCLNSPIFPVMARVIPVISTNLYRMYNAIEIASYNATISHGHNCDLPCFPYDFPMLSQWFPWISWWKLLLLVHHDVPLHVVRPGTSSSEKTWNFTEDWNTTALYPHGISFTRIFMDIYGYSWIFMDIHGYL